MFFSFFFFTALFLSTLAQAATNGTGAASSSSGIKKKVYGVNIGNWLVVEPWMMPDTWKAMGGEDCKNCDECINDEFSFAKAYPDKVDEIMAKHWDDWFNQADIDALVEANINTVRIPLGYWIVEQLVDRKTEFFARGGMKALRRGLKQLKEAGLDVILDHHGLPGAQEAMSQFAGRCTKKPEFFNEKNYQRALTWTAVMTTLSHVDPAFGAVTTIQSVNEPKTNADETPGYGTFNKNFVQTIRLVETTLGLRGSKLAKVKVAASADGSVGAKVNLLLKKASTTAAVKSQFPEQAVKAVAEAAPILLDIMKDIVAQDGAQIKLTSSKETKKQLVTNFMDANWQRSGRTPAENPADGVKGPASYDNHLYYVFGGVAEPNPEAYMFSICNLDRVEKDAEKGNDPLLFGEWSLASQFEATDDWMKKFADAQKLVYGKGGGWLFWNFKVEGPNARQWSYLEGVKKGFFTKDPAQFNDPNVCAPYIGKKFEGKPATPATPASSASPAPTGQPPATPPAGPNGEPPAPPANPSPPAKRSVLEQVHRSLPQHRRYSQHRRRHAYPRHPRHEPRKRSLQRRRIRPE